MSTSPVQLAYQIRESSDENQAQQIAQQLINLIPTFSETDERDVIARMAECYHPKWKSDLAVSITESVIANKPNPSNPLTSGIRQISRQIAALKFSWTDFVPSAIQAIVIGIVLLFLAILWPYGFVPTIAASLWKLVILANFQMKFRTHTAIEKMPYIVALGIYVLLWTPFALLCLPFVIMGYIGEMLARKT